jgi:tRNA-splicing ligase RtcB
MDFEGTGPCTRQARPEGRMKVPVRVYGNDELFEKMRSDRTLSQAANVATLPGVLDAVMVMPDGHEGYGFPIGGVAGFDLETGVISPGGVGYDINCGIRLIRTGLSERDVRPKISELVGSKSRTRLEVTELGKAVTEGLEWCVEKGYATQKDREHCEESGRIEGADFSKVSDMAKKRGAPQFGTLGSGNHFLEVQRVEKVYDAQKAKAFGIAGEGQITVMIHSGSRGLGHQVCDDYLRTMLPAAKAKYGLELADRELCCAPISSPEAQDYLGAMRCAVNFAFNNRQVMTHLARQSFEQVFGGRWEDHGMELVYDVCHNIAKFEEHQVGGGTRKVCVHRKGATRALWPGNPLIPPAYRSVGQPVIIPGSMNSASYLLCGAEGSRRTFGSSCHGAGRLMSRSQAKRDFNSSKILSEMEKAGVSIKVAESELVSEEYGKAYKDIDAVVSSVEQAGISTIVAKMVPLGVIKG